MHIYCASHWSIYSYNECKIVSVNIGIGGIYWLTCVLIPISLFAAIFMSIQWRRQRCSDIWCCQHLQWQWEWPPVSCGIHWTCVSSCRCQQHCLQSMFPTVNNGFNINPMKVRWEKASLECLHYACYMYDIVFIMCFVLPLSITLKEYTAPHSALAPV